MLKNKGFLAIFYHFFSVLLYLYPILYTHMTTKGQTMKKKTKKKVKNEEKGIWSDFAYEGLMKDNVKFMAGSEDNAISDEDYATCEALAQDGESIEEYAI